VQMTISLPLSISLSATSSLQCIESLSSLRESDFFFSLSWLLASAKREELSSRPSAGKPYAINSAPEIRRRIENIIDNMYHIRNSAPILFPIRRADTRMLAASNTMPITPRALAMLGPSPMRLNRK